MSEKRIFVLAHPEARRRAAQCIADAPDGWRVEIKPPSRTADQNAKMHAMFSDIARQELYIGRHLNAYQWKNLFISGHAIATGLGVDMVPGLEAEFWSSQPFDLRLPNSNGKTMHGNCDLCYLKGGNQVLALIREQPSRALWWIAQENAVNSSGAITGRGGLFRKDRPSYQQMYDMAMNHGELFAFEEEALIDCACTD